MTASGEIVMTVDTVEWTVLEGRRLNETVAGS
jgi:hypothetical protein